MLADAAFSDNFDFDWGRPAAERPGAVGAACVAPESRDPQRTVELRITNQVEATFTRAVGIAVPLPARKSRKQPRGRCDVTARTSD